MASEVSVLGDAGAGAATGAAARASASGPENHASSAAAAPLPKLRSCVVCRSRKVRCDKLSPCTNCRKANIACVVPSNDRPPRWARRLDRITSANANAMAAAAIPSSASPSILPSADEIPATPQVMDRLRTLENLVKELGSQLEQANAAAAGGSSGVNSHGSSPASGSHSYHAKSETGMQKNFGRLVVQDSKQSRYVGTGFWSRVTDELDGLSMDSQGLTGDDDTDSSDDEAPVDTPPGLTPASYEVNRPPTERYGFLFGDSLGPDAADLRKLRPLPSQIPFLLDIFKENVNQLVQVVHMPSVTKMMRDMRGTDMSTMTASNETLMFSIYYAAVISMEEDDVLTNFGAPKAELSLQFRRGLEHCLSKANFLNFPDITLVQACIIFLLLVRRHDSPRFVWMMVGLVIRMSQALGLHRDGAQFSHLSPFEIEMRRRVWWGVCALDIRASEDQGTDFSLTSGMFDTKLPRNVDEADLRPDMKELPPDRERLTDMTYAMVGLIINQRSREMVALGSSNDAAATVERQTRLLEDLSNELDEKCIRHADPGSIGHWVSITMTRLVICKLTLLAYLPALFSSSDEQFSEEIRNKLLVAAIELAEHNHALNAETKCRHWRWMYQTCTHWHAIVYLLIEISRRPLTPTVERAWTALHSSWLIPTQIKVNTNLRIWIPLQKLMTKARKHREAEISRLRDASPSVIQQLEMDDRRVPVPTSSGPFPPGESDARFREHWKGLINEPPSTRHSTQLDNSLSSTSQSREAPYSHPGLMQGNYNSSPESSGELSHQPMGPTQSSHSQGYTGLSPNIKIPNDIAQELAPMTNNFGMFAIHSAAPVDWAGGVQGGGLAPWLGSDGQLGSDALSSMEINMDLEEDVNWNSWLESANVMG